MRRFKKEHALITALLLLWHMLLLPITVWAADETADGIQIELRSTQSLVDSGNKFTYEIGYSVSSTTKLFTDAEIVLPLPKELVFASAVDAGDTNYTYDAGLHTVTFKFKDAVRAGTTGTVQVIVYFPNYSTPDGTAVSAVGTFVSGQGSKTSNAVTVTSKASAEWELKKERTKPVQEVLPEPGGEVEYKLTLRDKKLSASGRLELRDVVVRDMLPAEAQFVSATPAADKVENGQVTWNLGTLGQGVTSKELRVLVRYPSTVSGVVTNAAEAAYTPLQQSPVTLHAEVQHGFTSSPEDGGSGFFKSVQDRQKEASPGQDVNFYIGSLYSRANVGLQNYEVTDMTPEHLALLQIYTPTFTGIDSYKIQYTVADSVYGPWIDWKTVRADQRQTLSVSELTVPGAAVKGFKLVYGTVPVNFNQTGNFEIRYRVDPLMPAPAAPDETAKIINTAGLRYSFEGSSYEETRSAELYIVQNRPLLEVVKKAVNGTDFSPGETVHYQISARNSEYSSMDFQNPIIEDLLPPELEYVPDSARLTDDSGLGLSAPAFELGTGTDGRSLLRWSWNDSNPAVIGLGKKIELEYEAKIKAGTKSSYVDNVAEVTSDRHDYLNNADFTRKIYKNGRWYVYNNAPIYVHSTVKLESVKWVQGDLDGSNWTQYPSKGLTTPGGKVEYRLQVTNVGNIAVKGLLIVDALPRVGDRGVVDTSPRDSGWSPVLTGKVITPDYITVYYSTDTDIAMSGGHWSAEPPSDLTTVTALKFVFSDGHVIAPGAQEEVKWVMRAPVNAPTDGQTAWSSFGYTAQRVDNGKSLLTTEPLKVGVVVQEDAEGEIGNYVWRDANGDGVQNEAADQGVNGVHVELYTAAGNLVQTTITGNDFGGSPGYYLFTNLSSGSYQVKFNLPDGYGGWTEANQTADASDSDADTSGWSERIQLGTGERYTDVDAGLLPPQGRIGDKVWLDRNGNGLQDAGEPGQDGTAVRLFDANGFALAQTVTSGGGLYAFEHLPAGSYSIQFDPPAGYKFTQQGDGSQGETDSNPDPASGRTGLVVLGPNESNNTIDAGLLAPSASLGNRVWLDENKNGLQDEAEPGLNGLSVELMNERGEVVQTASTVKDTVYGDGFYQFGSLWEGAYKVRFTLPGGAYAYTVQGKDAASDRDSNADPASGMTGTITLNAGEANPTIDAGVVPLPPGDGKAALGDYVWLDENGDGLQNDGDSGVNGIAVSLYNDRGALQASTVTASVYQSVYNSVYSSVYSAAGYYQFNDLTPGSYIVQFGLPDGYTFTGKGAGSDAASDSDVNTDGTTDRIALTSGQTDLTVDAGLRRLSVPPVLGTLGDYVWDDKNGDGVQNDGEPGVGGVTVQLLDERGQQLAASVTDSVYGSLGRYRFDGLSAGQYRIRFGLPSGYAFTVKGAGDNRSADSDALLDGTTELITLMQGQTDLSVDAGLKQVPVHPEPSAVLGDRVWYDTNGDGMQNEGETGVNGLFVHLYEEDGQLLSSTVTGSIYGQSGYYSFRELAAGKYSLKFELPSGYEFTAKGQGTDRSADSDAFGDGTTAAMDLQAGETNLTVDAGIIASDDGDHGPGPGRNPAVIGDYAWVDMNGDGIQNEQEPGLDGVLVTLYLEDGTQLTSTVTRTVYDHAGFYQFSDLQPGRYKVKFDLPSGYVYTEQGKGTDRMADSDVNGSGMTEVILLAEGESNSTIDAGFKRRSTDPSNPGDSGSGDSGDSGDSGGSGGDGSSGGSGSPGGSGGPGDSGNPQNPSDGGGQPGAGQPGGSPDLPAPGNGTPDSNEPGQQPEGSEPGDGASGGDVPEGSPGGDSPGAAPSDGGGSGSGGQPGAGTLPLTGEPFPTTPLIGVLLCAAAGAIAIGRFVLRKKQGQ